MPLRDDIASQDGVRTCQDCGFLFYSLDVERIRRCLTCKKKDRAGSAGRVAHFVDEDIGRRVRKLEE